MKEERRKNRLVDGRCSGTLIQSLRKMKVCRWYSEEVLVSIGSPHLSFLKIFLPATPYPILEKKKRERGGGGGGGAAAAAVGKDEDEKEEEEKEKEKEGEGKREMKR